MSCIIILDTETTGTDHAKDSLIEVGLAVFDLEAIALVDCVSWLMHAKTNPEAFRINRIGQDILDRHGAFQEPTKKLASDMVAQAWGEYDDDTMLGVVAHSAEFDRGWFAPRVQELPWICSRSHIEWPRDIGTGSLEKLALAHSVGVLPGHRAIHDVLTLVRVFEAVGYMVGPLGLERLIKRALRPRARYQAIVSYASRDEAKRAGFQWDGETRRWLKTIAIEDANETNYKLFRIVRADS